ncbi:hypothetical protein PABG_11789 [Paracoccidioides brasiliensis Pb03]|nr:hypothetical protein PABG_11789 [Paracoccidioides brasiliensis Pb03]
MRNTLSTSGITQGKEIIHIVSVSSTGRAVNRHWSNIRWRLGCQIACSGQRRDQARHQPVTAGTHWGGAGEFLKLVRPFSDPVFVAQRGRADVFCAYGGGGEEAPQVTSHEPQQ